MCGFEQSFLNGMDSIYCTGECEKMSEVAGRMKQKWCRQTAALEVFEYMFNRDWLETLAKVKNKHNAETQDF